MFFEVSIPLIIAAAVCLGIVLLTPRIAELIRRNDLAARQASHARPALRLGGLGLLAGLWVSALVFEENQILLTLLLCALPIFLSGILEDTGRWQSPKMRLSMAAVSGGIVIFATGSLLHHVGIPGVDELFVFYPVAVGFTLFATVGIVHAINLVDGLNGLAGAVALVATTGMAIVGHNAGADTVSVAAPVLVGAILGFLALNFPAGRIFLGDAGAYSLGFVLAWLSVFLMADVPELSPWAVVMLFFWPVIDTFLAMWRRQRNGVSMGQADRLHFHQVVMRAMEIVVFRRKARKWSNPLTTLAVTPFMIPPAIAGVLYWDDDVSAGISFFVFGGLFVAAYLAVIRLARHARMPLGGRDRRKGQRQIKRPASAVTRAEAN